MENTINNDLIARDFKKRPVVSRAHPVFRKMVAETFYIAPEIVLQPPQPLHHPTEVWRVETFKVFFGLWFEFDAIVRKFPSDQNSRFWWRYSHPHRASER